LKARTASAELELGDLIPVVIVDEHTAHQLLALMKGSAVSVLPTTDFGQSGYNFTDRNMPTYFMSIACGQSQYGLVRFLGESWPHYLRSEADRVGRALLDLFWETEKIVFEAAPYLEWWNPKTSAFESKWNPDTKTLVRPLKWIERRVLARQYALVNLSLDQHSIDATGLLPTYWTPLLRRTRRRLNNDWALRTAGGSVQEFVSHVFQDLPEEANPLMGRHRLWHRDQIKALNDYFNLPERLHLTEFRGLNRNEVVELIRRKLGEHESFREEIKVVEVLGALATAQAQMLLAQLADYYQSRQIRVYSKTSAALEQINTEDIALKIHAATEECSGEGGVVLLAQAVVKFLEEKDRGKPQPVGVIAIRVLRDLLKGSSEVVLEPEVEEELSASCELRFLWVHPHHRERGIGRLLIGTAIEWARARGYGYLRAAILPQLTFAIQLTLDQGFEPIDVPTSFDNDKSPHRRIFRLKLSR
jgi:GNAT superfamily N-acetyltransferase